jgi:hypothetical protein
MKGNLSLFLHRFEKAQDPFGLALFFLPLCLQLFLLESADSQNIETFWASSGVVLAALVVP